jgi:hypothetical protein
MKVTRFLALGAVLLLVAGCKAGTKGTETAKLPTTPEEAVTLVHAACLAGEYESLTPLFKDGARLWESDPAYFKSRVEKVCVNAGGERAPYLEVRHSEVKGEGAMFQTFSYAKEDQSDTGGYSEWQLIKEQGGWRIVSLLS